MNGGIGDLGLKRGIKIAMKIIARILRDENYSVPKKGQNNWLMSFEQLANKYTRIWVLPNKLEIWFHHSSVWKLFEKKLNEFFFYSFIMNSCSDVTQPRVHVLFKAKTTTAIFSSFLSVFKIFGFNQLMKSDHIYLKVLLN